MINRQVAIITGVSSGIGLATAQYFHEKGWVVVGTVRERKKLAPELTSLGLDLQVVEMTEPKQVADMVKNAHKTYGRIDALVANAGYGLVGPVEQVSYDKLQHQMSVNVSGVAELVRLIVPIMRKQKFGVICAISSIAGRMGVPEYGAYSASKFALEGLFESLWYELRGSGIRLRLIEPSSVSTPFWTTGLVKVTARRPIRYANHFLARTIKLASLRGLLPQDVARHIFRATTSESDRLRWGVGVTRPVMAVKKLLPDWLFRKFVYWYSQN